MLPPTAAQMMRRRTVNNQALAYAMKHGKMMCIDEQGEWMLPLEHIQGFLDLLTPGDVPPEKLQLLYAMQAQLVHEITAQTQHWTKPRPRDASKNTD